MGDETGIGRLAGPLQAILVNRQVDELLNAVGHMPLICIKVGREAGIDKGNSKRAARTTDWQRYLTLWPNPFSSKALLQSCA